jgi:hypothetical protein
MRTSVAARVCGSWVVSCVVAAGCGTAGAEKSGVPAARETAAAAAAIPHACTLLPKVEAEAIVGEPLGDVRKGPEPPPSADVTSSQCFYPSSDGSRSMGVTVRHSKRGDNSPGYARQAMVDSGVKVHDVAGVGDTAFWAGVQLQAFRGAHLEVVVTMMGIDRPEERATAAARKVLEKL